MIRALKLLRALDQFDTQISKGGKLNMVALIPSLLALAGTVATIYAPQIQALIAAHPTAGAIVGALFTIVANFAPQPHKQ